MESVAARMFMMMCGGTILLALLVNGFLIVRSAAGRAYNKAKQNRSEWRGGHSGFRIINNDVEGK